MSGPVLRRWVARLDAADVPAKPAPTLWSMLGAWSPATRFAVAGPVAAVIVLEAFGLPVWPAVVIAFVFSWAGERVFPNQEDRR